jgi:peptidoglycan/LPS O-acetylase OafA/YrhL
MKEKPETSVTLLARVKHSMVRNRRIAWGVELLGLALMAFVVFIPRPLQLGSKCPQEVHSLYWALSKPIFILGLLFSVLPSILGIPTFLTTILTPSIFSFIARISFCTYLVHLMVIYQYIYTRSYDIYYNIGQMFVIYIGLLPIILTLGTAMTLTVEVPFGNLVKIMTN